MDDLKITLDTLPDDDQRELAAFIQRQKNKKCRKDLELFQLLRQKKPLKSPELISRLYPAEPNPAAYYALRKRLMRHLTDFILLKRMEEDTTAASSIMGLLSLAHYLFDVRVDHLAWAYLRKAEKQAQANEQYDLLNAIYNLQIAKADNEFADDLDDIIRKRNQNKVTADEDERANIANSLINRRLQAVRQQGIDLHFDKIIQEVLQAYQLTVAVSKRPSLLYKLMSIARSAILARKDFFSFEPFIISQYHEMEQRHGFSKPHQYYKLSLLYMIAHVLYRNKKFSESVRYLGLLHEGLTGEGKNHYALFYPRYIFLMVANYVFLHRNDEAILLMEKLLHQPPGVLSAKDQLTAQFGLSFNYFAQGAFQKANRVLMSISHSDKVCERKMGREWVLKKNMGELIIQYELGNDDLVLNKIRSVERAFGDLLEVPAYRNVKQYLQLIRHMVDHPEDIRQPLFLQHVHKQLEFSSFEQADIQALSFYAWLKAKIVGRSYYEVLLELAKSEW
jgi:hypothetical protein